MPDQPNGNPPPQQPIACAACGKKYGPDDPHPCLDKARQAEREREEGWPDGEPDAVEHFRVLSKLSGDEDGASVSVEHFTWSPLQQAMLKRAATAGRTGELAYFRDDTPDAGGTEGQHLCLCPECQSCLKSTGGRALCFVGHIEGPTSLRTILTEEQAKDWRPDVDGCDMCGQPPYDQERVRSGPSERFKILYLDNYKEYVP